MQERLHKHEQAMNSWIRHSTYIMIGTISILTLITLYYGIQYCSIKSAQHTLNKNMRSIDPAMQIIKKLQHGQMLVQKKIAKIEKRLDATKSPAYTIEQIAQHIPNDVRITSLDMSNGSLAITGESKTLQSVMDFLQNLNELPACAPLQLSTMGAGALHATKSLISFTLLRSQPEPIQDTPTHHAKN